MSVRPLLLLSIFLFVSIAENEKISLIVQLTELTSHFREGNERQQAKSDFLEESLWMEKRVADETVLR